MKEIRIADVEFDGMPQFSTIVKETAAFLLDSKNGYCCKNGFFMIAVFSVLVQRYTGEILKENQKLTGHLEQEVTARTEELTVLPEERKRLLAEVAHDLKAPISSILTFIDYMKISNIGIDDETGVYLKVIEQKPREMNERVVGLQNSSDEQALFHMKASQRENEEICAHKNYVETNSG